VLPPLLPHRPAPRRRNFFAVLKRDPARRLEPSARGRLAEGGARIAVALAASTGGLGLLSVGSLVIWIYWIYFFVMFGLRWMLFAADYLDCAMRRLACELHQLL
jgi:hypothetical protein